MIPTTVPQIGAQLGVRHEAFGYYRRLGPVVRYVEAHLAEGVSLAAAARAAGLESKYFSAFFHSRVGVRFGRWVNLLRVQRAIRLLAASDLPLAQVAFEAGFQEIRSFQRVFKQMTGMTPRSFRTLVKPDSGLASCS